LGAPHDKIPLPRDLYRDAGDRANSMGLDLSNEQRLGSLAAALLHSADHPWRAAPMLAELAPPWEDARALPVLNPADSRDIVGPARGATPAKGRAALAAGLGAAAIWASTPGSERAQCLMRAAQMMEDDMQALLGLIVREAGKSLPNA